MYRPASLDTPDRQLGIANLSLISISRTDGISRRVYVGHQADLRVQRPFDVQLSGEVELPLLAGCTQ